MRGLPSTRSCWRTPRWSDPDGRILAVSTMARSPEAAWRTGIAPWVASRVFWRCSPSWPCSRTLWSGCQVAPRGGCWRSRRGHARRRTTGRS